MNQMIDERLMEWAAEKAHISVQPEDVDHGIETVARIDPLFAIV